MKRGQSCTPELSKKLSAAARKRWRGMTPEQHLEHCRKIGQSVSKSKGGSSTKFPRRSLFKQESIVAALWEFASSLQHRPTEGVVSTQASDGTRCSLKHVEATLRKIMGAFGYEVIEIQ